MEIRLTDFSVTHNYFSIFMNNRNIYTSKSISKLFNLDIDTFNKLLVDKVIQHDNYIIESHPVVEPERVKDLLFRLNDVPKEIYIERFKETFTNQLTLIILGGIQ